MGHTTAATVKAKRKIAAYQRIADCTKGGMRPMNLLPG